MKTTKELARELGLLRQRRNAGNDRFSKKRPRSNCQQFSYLIILDYESTCWEQKKFQTQEIIEFPAVLLNTSTGVVESEFHYYVMPEEQPMLSDFCKQLTGITQEQVDNGIPLRLCLRKFSHWLDKLQREKGLVFDPPSEDSTEASYTTFVTWSDWDLGTCLLNECKRKQLLKPSQLNNWIDLRATYRKFYDRKPNGLNGALQDLGIEFEGREHSGIVDARNTATLAYRMMCDGCVMKITKSLNKGRKSQSVLTSNALVTKETRSPTKTPSSKRRKLNNEERDEDIIMATPDKNSDSCIKPILRRSPRNLNKMQNKVVSLVRKSPRDSKKTQNNAGLSAVRRSPRFMKHSKEVPSVNSATNVSTPRKHIVSKGFSAKQIYVDSNSLQAKPGSETCSGNGGLTNRDRNATETRQNCGKRLNQNKTGDVNSCNKFKNPDVELGVRFKVPSPNTSVQTSFCKKSPMNISNSFMNSTNSILKTPDINTSTSMKATPPMCKCGRRSKRRMVQSPGPNLGRFFFSCSGVKSTDRNGCGFFKWESSIQSNGTSSRHQSFVSKYNLSSLSKPFTPVFQQGGGCNSSAPQKRSLGVRPSANRSCIR